MRKALILFLLTYYQLSSAQCGNCNSEFQYLTDNGGVNQSLALGIGIGNALTQTAEDSAETASNAEEASEIAAYEMNSEKALLSNKYYQEAFQKANGQ